MRRGDRLVLLLDEIDALVAHEDGRDILENLRIAYEQIGGRLGVVVFGGSKLRELLSSQASPFLRTAQWLPLRGLSLPETASLVREPLDLPVPDSLVEALWEQTGGHPLLLQAVMERAVELGAPVADRISQALGSLAAQELEPTLFSDLVGQPHYPRSGRLSEADPRASPLAAP